MKETLVRFIIFINRNKVEKVRQKEVKDKTILKDMKEILASILDISNYLEQKLNPSKFLRKGKNITITVIFRHSVNSI